MAGLNSIVNAAIEDSGLEIIDQFEKNGCLVWYLFGDTAVKKSLSYLLSIKKGSIEGFDNCYERIRDSHPLIRICGEAFSSLGKGDLDYDDRIVIHFPYNIGYRIGFGEVSGTIDTSGRPDLEPSFHIYCAPQRTLFNEINKKLTDPGNQSYHFYPTDMIKRRVNISDIPPLGMPSRLQFMYSRIWF